MKTKPQLIAEVALTGRPRVVVDIGYAQLPNSFLKAEGATVYGIDIVEAPAPYDKTFRCDLNTDRLPFKDSEVDVVTMGCTLAHVANPLRALGEANRILSVRGTLVVSSPNPNYYWENVLNIFYRHFKSRVSKAKHVEHFFEFSRYNMRTIAERAGFEIADEIGCTFSLVKTSLRFNPIRHPGLAYEIIYVLTKIGSPQSFATFEGGKGIERIPTKLYE